MVDIGPGGPSDMKGCTNKSQRGMGESTDMMS